MHEVTVSGWKALNSVDLLEFKCPGRMSWGLNKEKYPRKNIWQSLESTEENC